MPNGLEQAVVEIVGGRGTAERWIHTRYQGGTEGRFMLGVGCWENVVGGTAQPLSTHASKEQAVAVGRVLAANAETTHVVHRRDGTVAYEDALNAEAYSARWFD